ncbi:MAG: transposase [Acidobacteria bacterium]|nr:transposase [Acidobacteriota bacterium]
MTAAPVTALPAMDAVLPRESAELVRAIPLALVRTSHERLRSIHSRRYGPPQLRDLPVRVAETGDGFFEIVDGFKRVARWADEGCSVVPAVVESAPSTIEQKVLLLRANAPPRATTPMDEARVIQSLLDDDGLGLAGIAQLLGRRKPWVVRRLALAMKLAPGVARKVDQGGIGPTLAYALCAVGEKGQEDLVRATERHALRQHEALALISSFRVASSDAERARLLSEPLPVVRPDPKSTSLVGPLAARLEERLARIRDSLADLASFQFPAEGLTDAEQRRVEAQHRAVLDLLLKTAQSTSAKETVNESTGSTGPQHTGDRRCDERGRDDPGEYEQEKNHDLDHLSRGAGADPRATQPPLRDAPDRAATQPRPQDDPPDPGRGGRPAARSAADQQARPVPRDHPGESRQASDGHAHPAGDSPAGLCRRPHDPDRLHPFDSSGCGSHTVPIAGRAERIHALVCELACSRKAHVHFYRNERQPTLLEGLARALEALGGVTQRVVFDSMSTIVLGRIGTNGKPIWHPRFLEFAKYYAFQPFLCRVRDPDRKGRAENFLWYLERSFVRGSEFSSFEELNERVRDWLDQVANRRVHGTTGLVPDEAWLAERDLLIRLPEKRFAVHQDAVRQVGPDATIWIHGTPYTIPAHLAERSTVAVRLYAEHFEVLDRSGNAAFCREPGQAKAPDRCVALRGAAATASGRLRHTHR